MKVFLGWSGSTSHKVALAFHGWLPKVIQAVKPYISSEDIAKGSRWASEIAKELESSTFGIIFVTKENAKSEWINFEAGALSREIEKSFVTPFLFDLRSAEVQGPLGQFQNTVYTKEEILKLVSTINIRQGETQLSKEALAAAFEVWWPSLKEQLDRLAKEAASTGPAPPKPDPNAMLEELLEMTRAMQRESWSLSNKETAERQQLIEVQKMGFKLMNDNITHITRQFQVLGIEIDSIRSLMGPASTSGLAAGLSEPVPLNAFADRVKGIVPAKEKDDSGTDNKKPTS